MNWDVNFLTQWNGCNSFVTFIFRFTFYRLASQQALKCTVSPDTYHFNARPALIYVSSACNKFQNINSFVSTYGVRMLQG